MKKQRQRRQAAQKAKPKQNSLELSDELFKRLQRQSDWMTSLGYNSSIEEVIDVLSQHYGGELIYLFRKRQGLPTAIPKPDVPRETEGG